MDTLCISRKQHQNKLGAFKKISTGKIEILFNKFSIAALRISDIFDV